MALYRGKKNLICLKYGNRGGHCTTKESSFVGHMVMVVWGEEKSAMEMDYLFDMWQRVGTLDNKGRQNNNLSKKKKNYGFCLWRSVKAGWERFANYVQYMIEDGCSTVLA